MTSPSEALTSPAPLPGYFPTPWPSGMHESPNSTVAMGYVRVPTETEILPSSTDSDAESARPGSEASSLWSLKAVTAAILIASASYPWSAPPQHPGENATTGHALDSVPPRDRSLDDLRNEIDSLTGKGYGSSYGVPPNGWATHHAKGILADLPPALRPIRIAPMADGGIALILPPTNSKRARVDITNDEEIVVTLSDPQVEAPEYREVSPGDAASTLAHFLSK